MDGQKRRDDGMARRRKALGGAGVDKSIAGKNSFNADFIDLITRHAWGVPVANHADKEASATIGELRLLKR